MDYNDLNIDIRNLHIEWLKQPHLRQYWGERHAEAITERDTIKKKFEETKAEIEFKYRSEWEKLFPKIKMTEGALSNVLTINEQVKEAHNAYLKSSENAFIIGNIMKTLDDRKEALKNEVSLYIANYFDDHNIPDKVQEFVNEKSKEVINEGLSDNQRMKKIRKKRSTK